MRRMTLRRCFGRLWRRSGREILRVFFWCGGVVFLLGFLRFLGAACGSLRGEDEQECGGGVARGWLIIGEILSHFF
jgi:hypothetical protein